VTSPPPLTPFTEFLRTRAGSIWTIVVVVVMDVREPWRYGASAPVLKEHSVGTGGGLLASARDAVKHAAFLEIHSTNKTLEWKRD
jgi:hypothetical protein